MTCCKMSSIIYDFLKLDQLCHPNIILYLTFLLMLEPTQWSDPHHSNLIHQRIKMKIKFI